MLQTAAHGCSVSSLRSCCSRFASALVLSSSLARSLSTTTGGALSMKLGFSSLLAVVYMGRMLEAIFFRAPANPNKRRKEAPLLILIPLWILALANIWVGVQGGFVAGLAEDAANALFLGGAS